MRVPVDYDCLSVGGCPNVYAPCSVSVDALCSVSAQRCGLAIKDKVKKEVVWAFSTVGIPKLE